MSSPSSTLLHRRSRLVSPSNSTSNSTSTSTSNSPLPPPPPTTTTTATTTTTTTTTTNNHHHHHTHHHINTTPSQLPNALPPLLTSLNHLADSIKPDIDHSSSSSQPPILRTLHYLSGPSPFDGLITPIKQHFHKSWDDLAQTNMTRDSHDLIHSSTSTSHQKLTTPPLSSHPSLRPSLASCRAKSSAQLNEEHFGVDPLGFDSVQDHMPNPTSASPPPYNLLPSHFGSLAGVSFPSTPRGGPLPEHTFRRQIRLFWLQSISALISNAFLLVIVSYGLTVRACSNVFQKLAFWRSDRTIKSRPWDDHQRWKDEKVTKDVQYYAESCGYRIIEQQVETLDGYYLKVWKVIVPSRPEQSAGDAKGGYPVLIQHGLFQSSGSFITSEERSLAFWLAEHGGYQVYLGNNRGVFNMGHRKLKRSDPRFWDYNIKELALYDLPALVDHVLHETGYSKLAFIGHSQGNATMFCCLAQGMVPSLSNKLSCFIALAPAVYAGPLTNGFPFGLLKSMRWRTWRRVFGVLDFMPIMRHSVDWLPGSLFGFFGYQMFAFLFNWTDRNWLPRRKTKMFRFTPTPVSSAGIFWWTGFEGFSTRGCVLDPEVPQWWDDRFPPLAIYHGGKDYLVLTQPLLDRLRTHEKGVRVIRDFKLEDGEHCDHFWHADAVELCFHRFIEDIESTRVSESPSSTCTGNADPVEAMLVEPLAHLDHHEDLIDLSTREEEQSPTQDRDREQGPMMDLARDV